LIEIEKSELRN